MADAKHIGRCYCGAHSISATADALTVAYCHCGDCKRWTGAAAPAFAAFDASSLVITPAIAPTTYENGVARVNCPKCGSPLQAAFPYLPSQTYVPVGVLDNLETYAPELHCHANAQVSWVHCDDGLPRADASARDTLNEAGNA